MPKRTTKVTRTYNPRGRPKSTILTANPQDQPLVDASLMYHCRLCMVQGKPNSVFGTSTNIRRHILTQHKSSLAAAPNDNNNSSSSSSSNSPDTDTDSDSESDEYTPPKIREQIEQLNKDIAKNNEQLQSILAQLKNK